MLVEIVNSQAPDVIIYAGDDLDRFVPVVDHVLLKTFSHLITLTYPDLKPASRDESKVLSRKAKRILPRIQLSFSKILDELKVPFYFVNGNDDFSMKVDDHFYARVNDGYFSVGTRTYRVVEDIEANITLEEELFLLYSLYREGLNPDSVTQIDSVIYASISPSFGEFEKDEILDRLNNLKRLRHEDEAKLNDLLKTRENITNLAEAKIRLGQLYDRVLKNLQDSTPEIIKLALDALNIKVYASTEKVEIQGVIPLELPTTAQTSA